VLARTSAGTRSAIGRCWRSCGKLCVPPDSDLDVLVSFAEDRPDAAVKRAVRLEGALGRRVDVARLDRVQDTAPLLLLRAVDNGRVILDRDGQWVQLREPGSPRPCARRGRRTALTPEFSANLRRRSGPHR